MKTFGTINLESLPPLFLNDFCVIGTKESCAQAIAYAFNKVQSHERVNPLLLIEPTFFLDSVPLDSTLLAQLSTLVTCGCKIYSYFKENEGMRLQNYETLAQLGFVILNKKEN